MDKKYYWIWGICGLVGLPILIGWGAYNADPEKFAIYSRESLEIFTMMGIIGGIMLLIYFGIMYPFIKANE